MSGIIKALENSFLLNFIFFTQEVGRIHHWFNFFVSVALGISQEHFFFFFPQCFILITESQTDTEEIRNIGSQALQQSGSHGDLAA